jgi:hypothetical protein
MSNELEWKLRIVLYSDEEELPYSIKRNIYKLVQNDLKTAMMCVANKMPGWKFLDRVEAAISTENLDKQIRHSNLFPLFEEISRYIIFRDCDGKERLSIEEWKQFAKFIESEINEIIGYRCGVLLTCDLSS